MRGPMCLGLALGAAAGRAWEGSARKEPLTINPLVDCGALFARVCFALGLITAATPAYWIVGATNHQEAV